MNHRHPEGAPRNPLINKAARYANPLILAAAITMFLFLAQPDRTGPEPRRACQARASISTLTAGEKWLAVEWSALSSNGGPTVTAYDVRLIQTSATDKSDFKMTV